MWSVAATLTGPADGTVTRPPIARRRRQSANRLRLSISGSVGIDQAGMYKHFFSAEGRKSQSASLPYRANHKTMDRSPTPPVGLMNVAYKFRSFDGSM